MNAPLQLRQPAAAPRGGATRPGERATGVLAFSRRLVPLLFLVLLLAVLEMFFRALSGVANVPISKVSVNGDFRFLDKARLEEIMLPHLGTGYFMVDLQRIRDELQAQPLVHEVTVRRAWPDRLVVFITEQVPVLRFGTDGYLNPYAEVFRPEAPLPGVELPVVEGPSGSEQLLLRSFDSYTEVLEPSGLRIASIALDGKHAWRIGLSNGTQVLLGRRGIDRKLQLLVRLLSGEWASSRDRIARIDMRYSNGVAVAWRDGAGAAQRGRPAAPAAAN